MPFRTLALSLTMLVATVAATTVRRPAAAPVSLVLGVDRPGASIAKTMVGLFFEDINFAADGGLYPERVKNRSFEFPDPLMGWKRSTPAAGTFTVRTDAPVSPKNSHYLRLEGTDPAQPFGVMNDGFRGVGVEAGKSYVFSVVARRVGNGPAALRVEVGGALGAVYGTARVDGIGPTWERHSVTFVPKETQQSGRLAVFLDGPGAMDVDLVSLFPAETYKNRPGGLRKDLGEMLEALHPGFLRFPGGCIVEGRYLEYRYQWKKTIGDPSDRTLLINRWNDEFTHKPAPDYYQSFGLGFFEYFQLAEDIGAEPLPILNCGMACQFNSGELAPLERLDQYLQDAVDLIEFANGPVTSTWGKRRADLGHPAPFGMKLLGVGNEQWGPRLSAALRGVPEDAESEVSGSAAGGKRRSVHGSPAAKEQSAALRKIGRRPHRRAFLSHAGLVLRATPRSTTAIRGAAPKIFVGEYAAHRPGRQRRKPQRVAGRAGGSRVPDRPRAERGRRPHVIVCAAFRARRRVAVEAEPDLVRQPPIVRDPELLRAATVRDEPRRDGPADYTRWEAGGGTGRAIRKRRAHRRRSRVPAEAGNSTSSPMPVRIEVPGAGQATGEAVFIAADPMAENSLSRP